MMFRHSLAAFMFCASLLGCATPSNPSVTLPLTATGQNTGQIGSVAMSDWGQQKTGFSFIISGVPNGASLPLRLNAFIYKGSCRQPGALAYDMNDQVTTERQAIRGWTFSRSAPVAMPVLLAGDYSVIVRSAATDGNGDIFCGDIPRSGSVK
ncbi:hypothetical protein PS918_00673 [Pseudomonas fluorescens]|uniref:Lipoprotein n=1 Tax=Pseudomonas fluorescens TaxID=294 RepID=A0A5E7RAH8_PSEFL|nr:hypothetical protein [Pseudomonas fluorescens]VVP68043.1 hypothetical protein PS918_00673 [Pseudomonas fluorescens]